MSMRLERRQFPVLNQLTCQKNVLVKYFYNARNFCFLMLFMLFLSIYSNVLEYA